VAPAEIMGRPGPRASLSSALGPHHRCPRTTGLPRRKSGSPNKEPTAVPPAGRRLWSLATGAQICLASAILRQAFPPWIPRSSSIRSPPMY